MLQKEKQVSSVNGESTWHFFCDNKDKICSLFYNICLPSIYIYTHTFLYILNLIAAKKYTHFVPLV